MSVTVKKIIAFFVVATLILGVTACGNDGQVENEITTSSTVNGTTTAETTAVTSSEQKEEQISGEAVITNGLYAIQYLKSDKAAAELAKKLSADISGKWGVSIPVFGVADEELKSENVIVIGRFEETSEKFENLAYNDFFIKAEGTRLLLGATNEVAYNYLYEYFIDFIAESYKNTQIRITHENNLVYSRSEIYGKGYAEFKRESSKNLPSEFMLELFEDRTFKGTYGTPMKYRLYVPFDYDPQKEYPTVLFFHGAGHRGYDNEAPVKGIVYNLFNHKTPLVDDMIVIVPQCPTSNQWVDYPWSNGNYKISNVAESNAMKTVVSLMETLGEEFSFDKSRSYVFGLSMGGYGTWDIITRHTDMFTAAAALCGGGDPTSAERLVDLPIWAFHAEDDPTVSVNNTRDMYRAIKNLGGEKIKYTEYAASHGYGHGIGTLTAKNEDVFVWLFSQRKA